MHMVIPLNARYVWYTCFMLCTNVILRTVGIGLSDGEVMERLWSYLRRFGKMTKEMQPSHRIDVLTHALLYYSAQKIEKISY